MSRTHVQRWPVVEVFGPTIQGEGVDQGVVSHFVRFGGCDFRCTWCDTPHAVLPAEVRANATKRSAGEILNMLQTLSGIVVPWIVITGGNPALHDLNGLVEKLHMYGYKVAVETQGSRWRDWMASVDRLCVSPKPPSAEWEYDFAIVDAFMDEALQVRNVHQHGYDWTFLKVVVFTPEDLDFAEMVRKRFSDVRLYLSAGNDAGRTVGQPDRVDPRTGAEVRLDLCARTKWLAEEVFKRPGLVRPDVFVQSQLHVAMWGNELGR